MPAAATAAFAGRPDPTPVRVTRAQYRMGTVLEIDAAGIERAALEDAVAIAFRQVGRVEERLSNWRPESELSRVNREAADRALPLSSATFWSLERALSLADETGGAFDPTVGSITRALGLTGEIPKNGRGQSPWETVGWRGARLDPSALTIRLRPGAAIDSGAFGKGEALDHAVGVLRRAGAAAARLNFGGQLALLGAGTREARRLGFDRVAVAWPDGSGKIACVFQASDGSVSTSGDAEKPGHLIDPKTGRAAAFHGSVTVVADTALRADALSTALFVMGPREGLVFADRRGIPALYLARDGKRLSKTASRVFPRLSKISF